MYRRIYIYMCVYMYTSSHKRALYFIKRAGSVCVCVYVMYIYIHIYIYV